MSKRIFAALLVSIAVIPAFASAQTTDTPLTRSQVEAQVTRAEQNGTLHQPKVHYPQYGQAVQAQPEATGYGAPAFTSSQSGTSMKHEQAAATARPDIAQSEPLFAHH